MSKLGCSGSLQVQGRDKHENESHLPSEVNFVSEHHRLWGSMLASFGKRNGKNKNGPLNMLIAEISLWACRANYLFGLAMYVESSWGRRRFVHTHNVTAQYVNAHLHSVSICQPYACKNQRRDGKARSSKTYSSKSWLIQVALLKFLLRVKLSKPYLRSASLLHLPSQGSFWFCWSLSQRGPSLVMGLLVWEAAASLGNADATVYAIQGTWAKGGDGTSCAWLWWQGKCHTAPYLEVARAL